MKAEKLVELMMVSGIPTASGYEERIRFSELEVVDRGANEQGLLVNAPEGHAINGWDVNVAGVRITSIKRTVRYHQHAVTNIQAQSEDMVLTNVGIHHSSTTARETRFLCGTKVWGFRKAPQKIENGITWQDTCSSTTKEQKLDSIHIPQRWW